MGKKLFLDKKYTLAVRCLELYLSRRSHVDQVRGLHLLAHANLSLGELDKARDCFLGCVRLGFEDDWQSLVSLELDRHRKALPSLVVQRAVLQAQTSASATAATTSASASASASSAAAAATSSTPFLDRTSGTVRSAFVSPPPAPAASMGLSAPVLKPKAPPKSTKPSPAPAPPTSTLAAVATLSGIIKPLPPPTAPPARKRTSAKRA
jgi:hypothetical protein